MLTNSQFDEVERTFEARRNRAMRLKDERLAEINAKFPVLEEINTKLCEGSIEAYKLAMRGNTAALDNLKRSNQYLIEQKKNIITQAGYPEDYLENVYECPICKDTGRTEDGRCRCYTQTIINLLYLPAERKELLKLQNFATFREDYYDNETEDPVTGMTDRDIALNSQAAALEFCTDYEEHKDNLLIVGSTGTGKTFLANCITAQLTKQGVTVLYLPAFEFFRICERARFTSGEDGVSAKDEIKFVLNAECLIIDDLGAEFTNSFVAAAFYECLEERRLHRRPTVITTNLNAEAIKNRYSERVYSRLLADFKYLKMPGDDNRLKEKKRFL